MPTDPKKQETAGPPRIGSAQIALLKNLCNASSISGYESEVRKLVLEQLKPTTDQVKVDALGNVLVTRLGAAPGPRLRVMLSAHMDEVGFIIVQDDGDGIFKFELVGGADPGQLAGKPVVVGKNHVPGVIGFKPIHLTTAAERKTPIALDGLRIDTGMNGNGRVKVGDYATFAPNFQELGSGSSRSLASKALDDRVGVANLLELVRHAPPNIDLLAAFTTQEEIGLRGAAAAAYAFDPDLAIALDCTPANDLPPFEPDHENERYNSRLNHGPALYVSDRGTISDPRLVRHFIQTAEAAGLPYQIRQPGGGGTDAGAIHKSRAGIPSISISVPGRYLHTPISMIRLADWRSTLALVYTGLAQLSPDLLAGDRQ